MDPDVYFDHYVNVEDFGSPTTAGIISAVINNDASPYYPDPDETYIWFFPKREWIINHDINFPPNVTVMFEVGTIFVRDSGHEINFGGPLILTETQHFLDESDATPDNNQTWTVFVHGGQREYFTPLHFGAIRKTPSLSVDASQPFMQCQQSCTRTQCGMFIPHGEYILSKWLIRGALNGVNIYGSHSSLTPEQGTTVTFMGPGEGGGEEKCMVISAQEFDETENSEEERVTTVSINIRDLTLSIRNNEGRQDLLTIGDGYGTLDDLTDQSAWQISLHDCLLVGNRDYVPDAEPDPQTIVGQRGLVLNATFYINCYNCSFGAFTTNIDISANAANFYGCRASHENATGKNRSLVTLRAGRGNAFYGGSIEAGGTLVQNFGADVSFYDIYFELAHDVGFLLTDGMTKVESCFISRCTAKIMQAEKDVGETVIDTWGSSCWRNNYIRLDLVGDEPGDPTEVDTPFINFVRPSGTMTLPHFVFEDNRMVGNPEEENTGLSLLCGDPTGLRYKNYGDPGDVLQGNAIIENHLAVRTLGACYYPGNGAGDLQKISKLVVLNGPAPQFSQDVTNPFHKVSEKQELTASFTSAMGWKRIAVNGTVSASSTDGLKASASFVLEDIDGKESVYFTVTIDRQSAPVIIVNGMAGDSGANFTTIGQLRVVYSTASEDRGAAVEFYLNTNNGRGIRLICLGGHADCGWKLIEPEAGSVPGSGGYTTTSIDLSTRPLQAMTGYGRTGDIHRIEQNGTVRTLVTATTTFAAARQSLFLKLEGLDLSSGGEDMGQFQNLPSNYIVKSLTGFSRTGGSVDGLHIRLRTGSLGTGTVLASTDDLELPSSTSFDDIPVVGDGLSKIQDASTLYLHITDGAGATRGFSCLLEIQDVS